MARGRLQTSNALLQASAKEAARNSNFHQRLALSHRAESCAHFDCTEPKTGQSQVRSEAVDIVALRNDFADVHTRE